MSLLFLDLETFSPIPIQNGNWAYAEKAEILLFSYAIDDEAAQAWDVTAGGSMPVTLSTALSDPETKIIGHNIGGFDRVVLKLAMGLDLPIERVHDTMAQAYSHGLPGSLDVLCDILQAPFGKIKDKEGKKLIQLFCVPKKAKPRVTRKTHPLEWDHFISYAKLDIEATRFIYSKLPKWNYPDLEHGLWCLDQAINARGFAIDLDLVKSAIRAVDEAQKGLKEQTQTLSLGLLASTTQRDAMLKHILEAYDVDLPDLTLSTVERRMEDPELPPEMKELLSIRLQASSTSTAKYGKLLRSVSSDGRLRGTLQYCGASRTGRFSGRQFQPQNLARPAIKKHEDILFGIEAMKANCEDLFFPNVMELASSALRSCIVAGAGKKIVVSDLSGIEARVLPWLAGETSTLDAYRALDAGTGPDLYNVDYAEAFRIAVDKVTKEQRQIGKVMRLMLGYGAGVGGFITGAAAYKIDLNKMAAELYDFLDPALILEAKSWWEVSVKEKRTFGLEERTFITCDVLKRLWRRNNPNVVSFWRRTGDCVSAAIEHKNKEYKINNFGLSAIVQGAWLRIILPSKRSLCYAAPRMNEENEISYMGMSQYSRKWGRTKTYPGKLAENITQAVARDVMTANMPAIENAGYSIILSVHDELVTEPPDEEKYTSDGLSAILATNPIWAPDLPLAAGGFESYRYRKAD